MPNNFTKAYFLGLFSCRPSKWNSGKCIQAYQTKGTIQYSGGACRIDKIVDRYSRNRKRQ